MTERTSPEALLLKALLLGLGLWLLYLNLSFALDALIALTIAAAILPLAEAGEKRRVPRIVTVLGLYAMGLGGLILLVTLLVPVVGEQGRHLVENLPAYRERATDLADQIWRSAARHGGPKRIELPELGLQDAGSVVRQLATRSLDATRGIFSVAFSVLLILFVAAYIVVDGRNLARGLLAFVPPARRREATRVGVIVLERMGGYVLGQVAVSICIAIILSIGLALIGIDTPILIGVTAGALNFVPFLGSAIALLLAVLVALNTSALSVAGVLILFGAESTFEGKVLVPYLLGRRVGLHPLAVLLALLAGAHLAGLIGAVVAVPIAAGLNAVLQETYVRRLE